MSRYKNSDGFDFNLKLFINFFTLIIPLNLLLSVSILAAERAGISWLEDLEQDTSVSVQELVARLADPEYLDRSIELTSLLEAFNSAGQIETSNNQEIYLQGLDRLLMTARERLGIDASNSFQTWFYPASGFDLATLVRASLSFGNQSKVFVMVSGNAPFLAKNKIDLSGFSRDRFNSFGFVDTRSLTGYLDWGFGLTHEHQVLQASNLEGGLVFPLLSRLKASFPHARMKKLVAVKEKDYRHSWMSHLKADDLPYATHGILVFDLGPETATHVAIYIHGGLAPEASNPSDPQSLDHLLSTGLRYISLTAPIFREVDGLFVRGSQGVLSPYAVNRVGGQNQSREFFLETIAHHRGVVLEGMSTTKIEDPRRYEVIPDGHSFVVQRYEDHSFKLSYSQGTRVSRLGLPPEDSLECGRVLTR